MKFKELTPKSTEELKAEVARLQAESLDMAGKLRVGSLKNTHKLKTLRKDIARIFTLLSQRD